MSTVFINSVGVVCSLGNGMAAVRPALFGTHDAGGLTLSQLYAPGPALPLGVVHTPLPSLEQIAPRYRSRNNALALCALTQIRPAVEQAIAKWGAARVGVVLGTSTAGQSEAEAARSQREQSGAWPVGYDYALQEMGNVAECVAAQLGTTGLAYAISSACSSGAKA